jgi:hypothetical protein
VNADWLIPELFFNIFYRFFWAFRKKKGFFWAFRSKGSSKTRGKKIKKVISAHHKNAFFFLRFFSPSVVFTDFFNRVFGRFVTGNVQKRDKKKSRENLLSLQKKYSLTYVVFFLFFAVPLGPTLNPGLRPA